MTTKPKGTNNQVVKLIFTCTICGITSEKLPSHGESQLSTMQQHAAQEHGITQSKIINAHRESPDALTYQWRLPDGRVYLVSKRFVEVQTGQKCVHYWILDSDNVGVCKYCKTKKDFGQLLEKYNGNSTRQQPKVITKNY